MDALELMIPEEKLSKSTELPPLSSAGEAEDFGYGIETAKESIESGAAYKKLKELIKFSGGDLSKLEQLENETCLTILTL